MHRVKLWRLLLGAGIALLVLAACGAPAPVEEEPTEEAVPVEEVAPTEEEAMEEEEPMEEEVEVMAEPSIAVLDDPDLGLRLVDGDGMTLYLFTVDEPDVSNCSDGCAANWPPLLTAAGEPPSVEGTPGGTFGVIARQDDTQQITFNTMPLYYFAADVSPGDTNGQGRGGVWFVMSAGPTVAVSDQPVVDGTVTIDRALAAEPGWMVIHADAEGSVGPFIGWAPVTPGLNSGVVVEIDETMATDTLYAMLHLDVGSVGDYEFPGDDAPVFFPEGEIVSPPFNTAVDPSVTVEDQAIKDGTVTVDEAIMLVDGWMVIHAQADGNIGPVIGFAPLSAGINRKVVVEIDTSAATDTLYAMLHLDVGAVGEYEFPDDDAPVILGGAPVSPPFAVTQ